MSLTGELNYIRSLTHRAFVPGAEEGSQVQLESVEDDVVGTVYIEKLDNGYQLSDFNGWLSHVWNRNKYEPFQLSIMAGRELIVDYVDHLETWVTRCQLPADKNIEQTMIQWTLTLIRKVNPGVEMPYE